MNSQLECEIAGSLDADPALIPFLPELFADLDELGSSAEQVACSHRSNCRAPRACSNWPAAKV